MARQRQQADMETGAEYCEQLEMAQVFKLSKPSSNKIIPHKPPPNSATNWGPRVQILEPMEKCI